MVTWKKKTNKKLKPEIILKKIDDIKEINKEGNVSYRGFEFHNAMATLYVTIDFPKELSPQQNKMILHKSISNIAKLGDLTEEKVLKELNNLAKIENAKKPETFNILTSVSISTTYPLPIKIINVGKSKIRFLNTKFPKKYESRNDTLQYAKNNNNTNKLEHENYTKVIISVKSKTPYEAAKKCLTDFDLFRAILTMNANAGMELIGKEWSPINKIRMGEVHTIHNKYGKNINPSSYWYETNYIETIPFIIDEQKKWNHYIKWVFQKLNECKYKNKLNDALIRYVRALDEKDQNVALINIWGALEFITAHNENNKDNVTKRCAYLYEEYEYNKQILEHLRDYRNRSVHAGDRHNEVKSYCYQLQKYFIELIFFHLHNVDVFNSLEEANQFLDQPYNIAELKHKRNLLNKAIEYRGGKI